MARLRYGISFIVIFLFLFMASPVNALTQVINYTDQGFVPANLMVKIKDKVEIRNTTSQDLLLFSTQYSSHINAYRFNLGSIPAGSFASITLTDLGTHTFMDRNQPSHIGKVRVADKYSLIQQYTQLHESENITDEATQGAFLDIQPTVIQASAPADLIEAPASGSAAQRNGWSTLILPVGAFLIYLVSYIVFLLKG